MLTRYLEGLVDSFGLLLPLVSDALWLHISGQRNAIFEWAEQVKDSDRAVAAGQPRVHRSTGVVSAPNKLPKMQISNAVHEAPNTITSSDARHDQAVTECEAASLLGVSNRTLRNWRWRHVGPPFVKYGERGPVRYIVGELIAWRDAHRKNLPSAGEKVP